MIDFAQIRKRLDHADRLLSGTAQTEEEVTAILKQRTRDLAKRRQAGHEDERLVDVTVVRRDEAYFGIPTGNVVEVRKVSVVTIPGMNRTIQGVFQVRGRLHSVVDLQGLLGTANEPLANSQTTFVVVVEGSRGRIGIRIDEPLGPKTILKKDVDEELSSQKSPFVSAVTRDLIAIIDIENLLGRNELVFDN